MASKLEIINLGLSHIAQPPITQAQLDAETGNVQVEAALRVWEFALSETLRGYNWGFAKVQEALVETTDYDPAVYTYAYVYPANCVAIRKIKICNKLGKFPLCYGIKRNSFDRRSQCSEYSRRK